jgi:hypothetical protein
MRNRKYGLLLVLLAWALTDSFVGDAFAQSENRSATESRTGRQTKIEASRTRDDGRGGDATDARGGDGRAEKAQRADRTHERDRRHRDSK